MSALNCFFGVELKPDGMPFNPVIPPQSSLVITQCAVTSAVPTPAAVDATTAATTTTTAGEGDHAATSAALPSTYSAVTLYVQSSEVPSRLAVCTLSPGQQLYFCPLQLIFGKQVTFTLVPQHKPLRAGAPVAYPSVHLTGYYEKEEDEMDGESDDEEAGAYLGAQDSEDSRENGDHAEDDGELHSHHRRRGRQQQQQHQQHQQQQRPPTRPGGRRAAKH